jgi:hypothetical protein
MREYGSSTGGAIDFLFRTFSDQVDPRSIFGNDNQSGGGLDQPGPNTRNKAGQRLIGHYSKWNIIIKAYNGSKSYQVGFYVEMP